MNKGKLLFWLNSAREELNKVDGLTVSDTICKNNAISYIDEVIELINKDL